MSRRMRVWHPYAAVKLPTQKEQMRAILADETLTWHERAEKVHAIAHDEWMRTASYEEMHMSREISSLVLRQPEAFAQVLRAMMEG